MSASIVFLSVLGPIITSYLLLKRSLGRRYNHEERVLRHLDRFLAAGGPEQDLTSEIFAGWCTSLGHLASGVRRARMFNVRNLCLYRRRSDSTCFVPDPKGFPRPHEACRPHFFTEHQITSLLRATERLRPHRNSPLYPEVCRLTIVLLHTTGLRRGELVRLTIDDYNPVERTLSIRTTKFQKSRLVPLSEDATQELESYLVARRRLPHSAETPLICNRSRGLRPYTGAGLAQMLRQLFEAAGVRTAYGKLPRVHDMRHSFAQHALLRWYRNGANVQAKLPALAAYMGHASVVSTQHYLALLEPFAEAASERFERHSMAFLDEGVGGGVT